LPETSYTALSIKVSIFDFAGSIMIRWERRCKQKSLSPYPPAVRIYELNAPGEASSTMRKGVAPPNIIFLMRYMIYEEWGLRGCKLAGWLQAFTCSTRE
jgi:hypothetical protein